MYFYILEMQESCLPMRKVIALFFIFLFAGYTSDAQRKKIDSLLKVVGALPDSSKMNGYYNLALKYINISLDSAMMFSSMSLELAKKQDNKKLQAKCYSLLGVAEKNRGNFEKAIAYHLQSLALNESRKDLKDVAITYNDLGVLYKNMKRYDEALNYYVKSNEVCRNLDFTKGVSLTYNNIGTIMKEKKLPDSAVRYYALALNVAEKTGDTYTISTCLSNIGETYNDQKNYDAALNIFKRCLEYDKKNEDKDGMLNSYSQIATTLDSIKMYPAAQLYADSAYRVGAEEKLAAAMQDVLLIKADISKKAGNFKEALGFVEQYMVMKDSIMNIETSKQIAEIQTKYETVKKEKQIIALERTRYQMLAIIGILVLLIAVAYLLYSRQQIRQRQAREKAVLEAEYKERMRIAKDVHDDLGSGLSKISLLANLAEKRATDNVRLSNDIHYISTISKTLSDNINSMVWVSKPQDTTIDHLSAQINDLGSGLSKISVTAQKAEENAMANKDLGGDIRQIAAMSKDLIDNMRDLIWVLNPENTTLDNLVARLREYCADYMDGIDMDTTLDFPGTVPSMSISREAQRNIFSTVKEAVNNCIKHAQATAITISLKTGNEKLVIGVADNGKGLDLKKIKSNGNGLRNMKQRIETIGGVFSLTSEGQGTKISIEVPYNKLNLSITAAA